MTYLFLVPYGWEQTDIDLAMRAISTLIQPTRLASSLTDFLRYSDVEGGFNGWSSRVAARYNGVVSPVVAVGRVNAKIVRAMLTGKKPVQHWDGRLMLLVTALDWKPGQSLGLLLLSKPIPTK